MKRRTGHVFLLAVTLLSLAGPASAATPDETGVCPVAVAASLTPELAPATLTWIGVVVILLTTLQSRGILGLRTLDTFLLALACLLLALRGDTNTLLGDPTGWTLQRWAYLLLAVITGYFVVRGLSLLRARTIEPIALNLSGGGLFVLAVVALVIAGRMIATGPLPSGARDAYVGGAYTATTGKLPYGQTDGHDRHGPLVYIAQAGVVKALPATDVRSGEALTWENRAAWLEDDLASRSDLLPARLLNAALLVLTLAGLLVLGARCHSPTLGATLVILFCVFPGALECVGDPTIMTPAALITWGLAAATLPGLGGLLGTLLMVLAGLAWPWAWLGVPVMLAYFLRQGWQGVGATLGLLGGAALALVGISMLTQPAMPQADRALAAAGTPPGYVWRPSSEGIAIVEANPAASQPAAGGFKSWIWKSLVEAENFAVPPTFRWTAAPGGPPAGTPLMFRELKVDPAARERMQGAYAETAAAAEDATRLWVSLRTVLESTWLAPEAQRAIPPAWALWQGEGDPSTWTNIRRGVKVAVGLLTILIALLLLVTQEPRAHHLIGGLTAALGAAFLATLAGPTAAWALFLPLVLAIYATHATEVRPAKALATGGPPPRLGAGGRGGPPRITVNA